MSRDRLLRATAAFAVAILGMSSAPLHRAAGDTAAIYTVTATYEGVAIDPTYSSRYFCHTRDYPAVRCFAEQSGVDADLGIVESTAPRTGRSSSGAGGTTHRSTAGTPYTIAYRDTDYRGPALTIYGSISNLREVGWSDTISSIKSIGCGQPRYYDLAGYRGAGWQNACDEWSSSLGAFNDRFSSVANTAP